MTDIVKESSSGAASKASGQTEVEETQTESKDSVAYDTYRKVLSEKKKRDEELKAAQDELSRLKKAEKEKLEAELKEKEDYKKLLELRDKEITEVRAKQQQTETMINESRKFDAFLNSLPGQLPKKFWSIVDTSNIVIDPTTGEPDPTSIKKASEMFQANYGELIQKAGGARLPNQAATGSTSPMTEDLWKTLSYEEKKKQLPQYAEYVKENMRSGRKTN